jgi:hypothetical protein
MAWTYDATDLTTATSSGRLNSTRLLVGDTDTSAQQVQDEEINFSLLQTGNNVYNAASFVARFLASKYTRMVDTQLDGALMASYSDRAKQYNLLAVQLSEFGKKASGRALGVSAGGIPNAPNFTVNQFDAETSLEVVSDV